MNFIYKFITYGSYIQIYYIRILYTDSLHTDLLPTDTIQIRI